MFFVGDYQQRTPRRTIENKVARLNIFILVVHIAIFAFAVMNIQSNITSTTASSYMGSSFNLTKGQQEISVYCENPTIANNEVQNSRFGQRYTIKVDSMYSNVLWARCLESLLTALTYNGVLIFLSLVNKVWFEFGRRFIRIRSITIPQSVTVTAQLICAIFAVISITRADAEAVILRKWLRQCGPEYGGMSNAMNATPNIALYAAACIDLFFQFLAYCAYGYYGRKRCRLDVDIIDVDGEQLATKRPSSFMVNGMAPKSNRKLIEALLQNEQNDLEEVTLDPDVISALERNDANGRIGNASHTTYPYTQNTVSAGRFGSFSAHHALPIGLTTIATFPNHNSHTHLPARRDRTKHLRPN